MLTRYVLMNFGPNDALYWEAHWCLLGLLAHAPEPREIVMLTDHPGYFRWFEGAVRIQALSAGELEEWQGPRRYFFRTLIKSLEFGLTAAPTPEVVVYMDTDTATRDSLAPLIRQVQAGHVLLDCREYNLYQSGRQGNKAALRLWQQVGERDWAGVPIDRATDMWNTGITALGRSDAPLIQAALSVCDALLAAGCEHRLTEQIAMSAVLTRDGRAREINPRRLEPVVSHYWANKRGWNEAITGHLATLRHRGLSLEEAVAYYRDNPITRPVWVPRTRTWHRWLRVEPLCR
ncbi:hypothetical protein [Candidatus Methylocalor cossyra]|uniref:Uncharacterized protein n=1 Tax=Candidatus Methylocalor cossyra TaxID=3108543 RepID=A0ABM9NL70_9GAMM